VGGRKGNEGVERETAGSHGEARSRARSSSGPMPKRRGEEMGGPGSTSAWGQEKKRGGGPGSGSGQCGRAATARPWHTRAVRHCPNRGAPGASDAWASADSERERRAMGRMGRPGKREMSRARRNWKIFDLFK
jgi:hypothetical protein